MSHFNHRALNLKYKDLKAIIIPNLRFGQVDGVEHLAGSELNDAYCLLKDPVTTEQFKVPLSEIQINRFSGMAFYEPLKPSHKKEALCLT